MSKFTLDQRTIDSAGAFLEGQLEKLDTRINMPLQMTTFDRDFALRQDFNPGLDVLSYTKNTYASTGGNGAFGNNFTGKSVNAAGSVQLDIQKVANNLTPWVQRFEYSAMELASSQETGQPVDFAKTLAVVNGHKLAVDQTAYIGDASITGWTGLYNDAFVLANQYTVSANTWASATPAQILADVNGLIASVVNNAGFAACPNVLLISPSDASILKQPVTAAGSISIGEFIKANNLARDYGQELEIRICKWSQYIHDFGGSSKSRVVAYNDSDEFIQFPYLNPIRSATTPIGATYIVDYYSKFGMLELRYPETVAYLDHA